ncbi:MAG: DUF4239 domain-containing protein [Verrucomicrobia bacterium]|nr:DUF4239 domain-containing protein [Verrucomicrobiota bacterium]
MTSTTTGLCVFACVFGAAASAMVVRNALPKHHLNEETKDLVKLAMGLVATMAALVLGLLVASAKGSYDTQRGEVIQMAGKVAFLDRMLAHYGPESAEARAVLRRAVEVAIIRIWPEHQRPNAPVAAPTASGDAFFDVLQNLAPQNDAQRTLKAQALAMAADLGQMRWLLFEQAGSSISTPLLVIVIFWLAILFFSFGLFGPSNSTAVAALLVAALSVAASIFLILELDQPFSGFIQISKQPMLSALSQLGH